MPALASFLHQFCSIADQAFVFVDDNLEVVRSNRAFRDLLGISAAELEQNSLFRLPDGRWNGPALQQMLREQERQPHGVFATPDFEWTLGKTAGETVCVTVYYVTEFENDEPTQILIAIRPQAESQADRASQVEIGRLLSQATSIPAPGRYSTQILELCLFAICKVSGCPIGHALLTLDNQREQLVSSNIWRSPEDLDISRLLQDTREAALHSGSGIAGRLWNTRQLVWLQDIDGLDDPFRRESIESLGIQTVIGIPVHVGGRVRAVLEFFATQSIPPSEEVVRFCTHLCQLAARVIERHETTLLLREAQQASGRATLARSQFLANMSHELRTPMTAILGMLELSLRETLPSNVRDQLRTAQHSARNLLTLLNDILDHARLESDTLTLIEEPFRLCAMLDRTMAPFVERTTRKGLRWTLEVSPDVPDRLVGDAVRLKQIFDHLLDNAVKFTERGAIEILVELDQPVSDDEARLSFVVRDTGPGFSTDGELQLFQGFTQADSSFARRHRGAGLGLAICSALINRLGGQFAIESQIGAGTVFQFTLPFQRQTHSPHQPDDELSEQGTSQPVPVRITGETDPLSILLAEDTPANQKVIKSILVNRGHLVTIANNGQEAVDQFSKTSFDAVIMDLQMPMMDGYEATAAIREFERNSDRRTPIIALTAHSTDSDRKSCLEAGMDAYLAKPIDVAELVRITESSNNRSESQFNGDGQPSCSAERSEEGSTFDFQAMMKRLGGDEELFETFIEVFNEDAPGLLKQLRAAISSQNFKSIEQAAHSLKGLAANFSANAVVELTSQLENAGKESDLSEADDLLEQLSSAVSQLQEALETHHA